MKFKQLLTKSLLVAVCLLAGQSVWGKVANLTPTADTYFSWNTGNGNTSYGTGETLYCGIWQEMWTNATPGLKGNGSSNIAVFKFDVSDYKGKITGATFKVTATNPSTNSNTRSIYLGYFDSTSWTESSTANNSGMNTRTASGLNIHPFNLSQSIAKGETKEVSFSSDAFLTYLNNDEDGIVSLIIYGVGQECTVNSKEAASGKPSLTLTYTDETVYTATFTANSGAITPTVTIYSDEERTTPVTNGTLIDKTPYYYRAVLAGYNNYESSFTVDGANPSESFTMTEKTRYTFTVNAVDESSDFIKAIYTDEDSYEGKSHTIVYPKYLTGTGNIVTHSKDNDTYGESKIAQAKNEEYTVNYKTYDGVAYFVEIEDVVSATAYPSWNCSKGGAVRGFTDAKDIFTVPETGVYDITYAACNNNVNYDMAVTLSKNETEIDTKSDLKSVSINYIKSDGIVSKSDVFLASGDVLKLKPSTSNGIIDYMLIKLDAVSVTIASSGYSSLGSAYGLDFAKATTSTNGAAALTAFAATESSETSVKLVSIDEAPAATGVILKGTPGATYTIPVKANAAALTVTNLLHAAVTATDIEGNTSYIMQGGQFHLVTEASTVPAGKAYLQAAIGAKALTVVFADDLTGIANVNAAEAVQPVKRIMNGQLVIEKNGKRFNAAGAEF